MSGASLRHLKIEACVIQGLLVYPFRSTDAHVMEGESWPDACPTTPPGAWGAFRASWPAFFLLALPVGGVYANLALCVGLRRERQGWKTHMSYPYAMSLACGDLINCMLVMPTAVINAYIGE